MSPTEITSKHGRAVAPTLRVRLLGPFKATNRDGAALKLPKKAQALLCYLIVNRKRIVPRDEAAALLWSNTNSIQARHSLRQCLSVLKKLFPPEASLHPTLDAQALHLSQGAHFDIDLVAFEKASKSSDPVDLALAEALYGGDLLLGLDLKHEPFEDWLTMERQRFGLARLNLMERLVRLRAKEGDLSGAIDLARRLLALDRYREESVRLLMQLLAVTDRRGMALVEHARMERLLKDELGLAPDATTRALAERIKRGQVTAPGAVSIVPKGQFERANCAHVTSRSRSPSVPTQPRAIVYPFVNLTGQRQFDDLARAITQDVMIGIACDRLFHVSSPDSSQRPSSGGPSEPEHHACAVTGTVRSDGQRHRVVVQLTTQPTGRCIWSDRFEITEGAPLRMQDDVCTRIAARLSFAMRSVELERTRGEPIESLSAYHLCLRAAASIRNGQSGNAAALRLIRKVLALDPEFGLAHGLAARCFHVQRMMGWLSPRDPRLAEGIQHANAAAEYGSDDAEALWMAGLAMMNIDGDLVRGRSLINQSLVINPHCTNAWIAATFLQCHLGDVTAALSHFRKADRLNPFDGSHHVQQNAAATTYFVAGDYETAHTESDACLATRPGYTANLRIKVATASLLGRADEAEMAARQLLTLEPGASISRMRDYWKGLAPNAPHALDATIDGWRRAGMPE